MAFRTAANYWKSTVNGLRESSSFTAATSPTLRAYASTADHSLAPTEGIKSKRRRQGDLIPVYVSIGFISMSITFGLFTVFHQMARSPNVTLKKSRREMIPEVEEPERVAKYGDQFVKRSFFRKIAHIQGFDHQEVVDDPIRADVFTSPVRLESIKDEGVGVKTH